MKRYLNRNIFETGKIRELLDELETTTKASDVKRKLAPDELALIPQIYGCLDPKIPITELENDRAYEIANSKTPTVLGADIKAMTFIMYNYPRSAYVNFEKAQVYHSDINGAVPLAMLGFKRHQNIPYNYWRDQIVPYYSLISKGVSSEDKEILLKIEDEDKALETTFNVDCLLGKTYASTELLPDGNIGFRKNAEDKWGLCLMAAAGSNWAMKESVIHYFRDHGFGNHRGSIFTSYGTATIRDNPESKIMKDNKWLYNICSNEMRLMLRQTWAWYGPSRSTDMITDFRDWDNQIKSPDTLSAGFVGLEPKTATTRPGRGAFGL